MKYTTYEFSDTDETGNEEYNLDGEEYRTLIEKCGEYCTVFSLIVTNEKSQLLEKLHRLEIPKNENITYEFEHYKNCNLKIKYYMVCRESMGEILSNTKGIFCFINGWGYSNPEDLTFYRKDGSVFFTSTVHEGECKLFVDDTKEDVSQILSSGVWMLKSM